MKQWVFVYLTKLLKKMKNIPENTLKIGHFSLYCNILQFMVLSAYYGKNCKNRAVKYSFF